ncbi:MAG: glycosyltransferase family 2 protein [Caulobacteraceae bacterium]|nr:glycosyltransferase family 2 protein [Caulobacteraceae bacterium]
MLSLLGLPKLALHTHGGSPAQHAARIVATAEIGATSRAREMYSASPALSTRERRVLASRAAPFDPLWACSLLPAEDHVDRAACAFAAGDVELAERLVRLARPSQQTFYLAGAIAARRGNWLGARGALNRGFAADGLAPPLRPDIDRPTTLCAFAQARVPAGVEGPLISVVMAARNAAATLRLSIGSLTAQTWRNVELLIVDDRSDDHTFVLARELANQDKRIKVLSNRATPGAYGARNTGVNAAHGEFIALHDADDWAHPQRLERQVRALGHDKGLTLCRHFRVDGDGHPLSPRVFPFVRLSPITALARSEAMRAAGPFEEVIVGADSEWLARFDGRFGRRAAPRTSEVGIVASWARGSLSNSAATGFSGEGLDLRLAYVEDWRRRHANMGR